MRGGRVIFSNGWSFISFKDIDLEKLFTFLKFLDKKLPKRDRDRLSDVVSSVNLEYFRIQKKYEGDISLESDPYIKPITPDGVSLPPEEPTDFLSNIIKVINDSFGSELSEDDKINLHRIHESIKNDELLAILSNLPNIPASDVPIGADENYNVEIKKWGKIGKLGLWSFAAF